MQKANQFLPSTGGRRIRKIQIICFSLTRDFSLRSTQSFSQAYILTTRLASKLLEANRQIPIVNPCLNNFLKYSVITQTLITIINQAIWHENNTKMSQDIP